MSDTPMTDDRVVYGTLSGDDSIGAPWVNAPFARHLERELNAANERIKRLEEFVEQLTNPKFTRDDLPIKELLQRIKRLEEALSLVRVECENVHHGKNHRHECGQPCPVVEFIEQAKEAKP